MPAIKIAASVRLIMAMFRLYAALEEGWGRQVKEILKRQYPDAAAEIDAAYSDAALGQKLLNIALKQTQYNETKAQDAIQSQLMYWLTGTVDVRSQAEREADYQDALREWEAKAEQARKKGKEPPKKPVPPKKNEEYKPFDFTKGSPTWEDALDNMLSNLRHKAMSYSQSYTKKEKKERSIDQAFGQRGEDGGAPEGGEGRMPTPEESSLGKALDDQAGIKDFIDVIDEHIDDLRNFLPEDERKLFDLIFDDEVGSFGSDIKENMNQASALKEKHPELYEKNAKRWSGYVGDLRKKLLESIWKFIDDVLPPPAYRVLRETFFADVDPSTIRKKEREKSGEKADYQQGIDERKIAKWKWQEQHGGLDDKNRKSYEALKKKLQSQGVDVDSIPAVENPQKEGWTLHSKRAAFSLLSISSRVAMSFGRTGT